MDKKRRQYSIDQSPLFAVQTKSKLERVLLMEPGDARRISEYIKYRKFSMPKSGGEYREILAPCEKLKVWQRRIWDLLARVDKPAWVISATKGKCYVENAASHAFNSWVLTMDIKGFYDSCNREYVYQFFRSRMRCSSDVSKILADLCTMEGTIPTGSPSSQIVAYFAYERMFDEINAKAASYGCVFSLYVDDMTFSSANNFAWGRLSYEVNGILRRYGHCAKKSKTRYYPATHHKVITGVALAPDGSLHAPNELRCRILGNAAELKKRRGAANPSKVLGQIQAASHVEGAPLFSNLKHEMENV